MVKIYKWGILGPGKIAHKFAAGLQSLSNANLYAIGSRDYHRAEVFGKQYGAVKYYGSYEELAADQDIDIIYIATPHSEHYDHALICLKNRKNVLCEKAFTVNAGQLEHLISLAKKNGLFLMEALWTRFLPSIGKVIEIIHSGRIGEVKMLHADFGFHAPYDRNGRLFNPALAGGSLLDIGIYPLFLSLLLLGEPLEVKALAHKAETGVDESLAVCLLYSNGALAVLSSTFAVNTNTRADIYGTRGNIGMEPRWFSQTRLILNSVNMDQEEITFHYRSNGYDYEAEEAMRCLSEGLTESPLLPLDFSMKLMKLMDKVRELIGLEYKPDSSIE